MSYLAREDPQIAVERLPTLFDALLDRSQLALSLGMRVAPARERSLRRLLEDLAIAGI